MNNKKISVVIATYYRPATLPKTIQSIKSQKLKPNEIVIVDNSKLQESKNLVHKLKKLYNLNLLYLNTLGTPDETRNYAVKKCKNSYIAFLDDDDTWKSNYLSTNFNLIKKFNLDFIFTNINIINEDDKKVSDVNLSSKILLDELFVFNHGFFCSNLIIKKKSFLGVGGFDKDSGSADKDLAIKLCEKKYSYKINKKKLVNKRVGNNQWSQNYKSMIKNNTKFFLKYHKYVGLKYKYLLIKKIIKLFINSLIK